MREKKESLVITFPSTTSAMAADRFFNAEKLPGRLIPVPREITAGCGLAWRALPCEGELLREALETNELIYEEFVELLL